MSEIAYDIHSGEVCCICCKDMKKVYGHPVVCKDCYSELSEADKEYYTKEY